MPLKEGQPVKKEEPILTFCIKGAASLWKATCPQLGISHYGITEFEAEENLIKLAKSEVKGILEGKGDLPGRPDERKPLAEKIAEIGLDEIETLFQKAPRPVPPRPGLK